MEARQVDPISELSGQTIRGYTLKELLGSGQLTAVYRVRKDSEATARILTIIVPPITLSESARERFLLRFDQESARLLSLKHPHIFPLEGWGQQAGYLYLLMPDLQGKSLASVLQTYGRCSPAYAVAVLERIAETLEYAHKHGVLHLGLSPARIFLHQDLFIQVAGFGLVRLLERRGIEEIPGDPYNALKTVVGTYFEPPEYLAPEIIQGQMADARADVYSLGILLYEMLCGRPPFTGNDYLDIALKHVKQPLPSLHTFCPDIPLALELVIHQALKRDPNQRFQKPQDLANACMRVLTRRSFAIVALNQGAEKVAIPSKVQIEHALDISKGEKEDSKELDQDLLRIWQASKSRVPYVQETPSHHPGEVQREVHPKQLAPLRPYRSISSSLGRELLSKEKTLSFPSPPEKLQSVNFSEESGPLLAKKPPTKQPQPDSSQVADLLAALENLPRPTYGIESDNRLLASIPDPAPFGGAETLRSSLGGALNELLPALPLSSMQRRRQKFMQMFSQQ